MKKQKVIKAFAVIGQYGFTMASNQDRTDKEVKRLKRLGFSARAYPCEIKLKI